MVKFGIAHGRFQPLHLEHLDYILYIKDKCDHCVVAITNPFPTEVEPTELSPHRHEPDANPWSFFERYQIIRDALIDSGVPVDCFSIVPLSLDNECSWPSVLPNRDQSMFFVKVFSDWERSKLARFEQAGWPVSVISESEKKGMTASEVRLRLTRGGDWRSLVPAATQRFIDRRDSE